MTYRSCAQLESLALNFNGRIDKGGNCMVFCCEPIEGIPGSELCDAAQDSLKGFYRARAEVIAESVKHSLLLPAPEGEAPPGVNDTLADYRSLIEIMKALYVPIHAGTTRKDNHLRE